MNIRTYQPEDQAALIQLWESCGLVRSWNPPTDDIARCLASHTAQLLIASLEGRVIGSIMAAYDGHRGWLYYLAVDPQHRGRGYARALVRTAETWLGERGAPKVQLMIRAENFAVGSCYARLGYRPQALLVMNRWLAQPLQVPLLDDEITYLHMHARPTTPAPAQPPGDLLLRPVARPGARFYRYLYEQIGEPWSWYERRQLSDAELEATIHDPAVQIHVLYRDGLPAGYFELRNQDQATELCYLGLLPEHTGQGIGRWLLGQAIEQAFRQPIARLWVHTCRFDHPKALATYQAAGFEIYQRETHQLLDPRSYGLLPQRIEPSAAHPPAN